jgi:uncharacterized heparinase superfamily protein
MWFFIKELVFFAIEKFFLNISRQFALVFSGQKRLSVLKTLPCANIGNEAIGQQLLKKINVFGNVILDVKADNPWRILPFSDEVEVGIDGFLWLNDLSIVNNQSSRELSQAWIQTFPLNRLNKNVRSSSSRLQAIVRNYMYLANCSESEQLKKIKKILKNDYLFLNFYRNFSFNLLERLCICHSLVLSGYAFNFTKKKQKKAVRSMIKLFILYKNRLKKGQIRSPEELSKVFFLLLETIEIAIKLESGKPSSLEEKLRKTSYFFGSSLRYLQFDNGSLVSAHGGSLGDFDRYVRLLGEIKNYKEGDEVSDLGFKRLNGARLSMIIDVSAPLYGKRDGIAHASFSSFELYYGTKAIFVNCGGGSRFGHQYTKYCQSSKAHNVLLFNEKSQCTFGKKSFSRRNSYYYIKDGPRNTKFSCENSLTEKIVELSHDAYHKDYHISVNRRISMDLVKNCVMGKDTVFPENNLKENLIDSSVMLYFHLHPSISCKKRRNGVLLEIPGNKKMFFTHKGGNLRLEKSTYTGNFNEPQEITKMVIENSVKQSEGKINWKLEEFID